MARPTHVYVGIPTNCEKCKGTGRQTTLGFRICEDGKALCEACDGSRLKIQAITLEDFAKLFTYGVEMLTDPNSTNIIGRRNVLMPAPPEGDGNE